MPIFKADDKLVLYAHVPKCGGSSVVNYLRARFGKIAFSETGYTSRDPGTRWSRTSPQHVDAASLARLFPKGFFDATFSIVRHPVSRIVSAYHFQLEVERTIPEASRFPDWLEDIAERRAEDPFLYDNHVRPMAEIVPDGAHVFHMEFGLDPLIAYCDALTGRRDGPRALARVNGRGDYVAVTSRQVTPSPADLALIAQLYAADFERFGYAPDRRMPDVAAPELAPEFIAERDAALREMQRPLRRLQRSLKLKKLGF